MERSKSTFVFVLVLVAHATMAGPTILLFFPQVERLGRDLLKESSAAEQAGLDLEVLMEELELERRKNRDLPHEIRLAEAHKAEALEAKASAFFVVWCFTARLFSTHDTTNSALLQVWDTIQVSKVVMLNHLQFFRFS